MRSFSKCTVMAALAGIFSAACYYAPVITPESPGVKFARTDPEQIQFYVSPDSVPFESIAVASITPHEAPADLSEKGLRPIRQIAAQRGANALILGYAPDGHVRFSAVHLTSVPRAVGVAERSSASGGLATPSASSAPDGSSGGSVNVRGYTRRDGTYVRPHTRSAPRSGGRRH